MRESSGLIYWKHIWFKDTVRETVSHMEAMFMPSCMVYMNKLILTVTG